jgi:tRNA (guanine37-N1)-methyltransferase
MKFDLITIFPDMFKALDYGVVGRAKENGLVSFEFWNPRDYAIGAYHKIDDNPYGGGPGMVMSFAPLQKAIHAAKQNRVKTSVICLTPQGKLLDQILINEFMIKENLILLAGRYEGIDERLIELEVDYEVSIGDYVLSGGEFAAMVLIDALTRNIPGALGNPESSRQDSFFEGLLDYPHYTRPEVVAGCAVPEVLLSGNHAEIAKWRRKQALGRTWLRRRDLLKKTKLTVSDSMLLNEFIEENKS